jgi:hypothetical protein
MKIADVEDFIFTSDLDLYYFVFKQLENERYILSDLKIIVPELKITIKYGHHEIFSAIGDEYDTDYSYYMFFKEGIDDFIYYCKGSIEATILHYCSCFNIVLGKEVRELECQILIG